VFWSLQHRSKESNVRNFALLIWNLSNFWMWCRVASAYRWTRHDFRLLLLSRLNLPSSGILYSIQWLFLTNVSGHQSAQSSRLKKSD
jgi:hypothetical protein